MTVFFIILAALAAAGMALYAHHRLTGGYGSGDSATETVPAEESAPEVCCGTHAICEKGLPPAEPVYFDDEELDRFAGRAASDYSTAEADEFRDVMLTMSPDEIAPWARSLQLRGIELPAPVRDELLLIVAEARKPHKQ